MMKSVTLIMDYNYEKEIASYHPSFYKNILNVIPSMPDFRPLSTIEKMKRVCTKEGEWVPEPQNSWRLLYEEFEAMSHCKEDAMVFQAIYMGDLLPLDEIMESYESYKEFAYTYPGLLWSLTRVGSDIAVHRFMMGVGLLDERSYPFFQAMVAPMSMTDISSLLPYLRDKETALFLSERFASFLNHEACDRIEKRLEEGLGQVYWLTANMEKLDIKCTHCAYTLVESAISFSSVKAVRMILNGPLFSIALRRYPNCLLTKAILSGNWDIFSSLYQDGRISLTVEDLLCAALSSTTDFIKAILQLPGNDRIIKEASTGLLNTAIRTSNLSLIDILLADPRIDPSASQNNAFCAALHSNEKEIAKRFLVSPNFRPMNMDSHFMGILLQKENKDLLDMVLAHPNTRKDEYEELREKYMREEGKLSARFKNYLFESFVDILVRVSYTYKTN